MIKSDLKIECELRGYNSPEVPRHLDNRISQKSVDSLVKSVNERFDLVSEYYEIKKRLLGLEKLKDYDRYAPIGSDEKELEYNEASKLVLDSFREFDEEFYKIANEAINNGWIDVFPKEGKRGGAFSHPATPDTHPYIMLNYTNKRRDIFTLSHELGHTIHQKLSYKVGFLNSDTPLTTAETASVFAEMLLFDSIKNSISKKELVAIYAGKLDDIFATLFRQIVFTNFERRVHSFEGELNVEDFNSIWMDENKKMFGKSIELTKNYELWWSYIPHFIHTPFYCYAYSYGQLLVLALYGLYKSGSSDFVQKYKEFLSSGGSKSPRELILIFGYDIDDAAFWQVGLKEVERMLKEFKEVSSGY